MTGTRGSHERDTEPVGDDPAALDRLYDTLRRAEPICGWCNGDDPDSTTSDLTLTVLRDGDTYHYMAELGDTVITGSTAEPAELLTWFVEECLPLHPDLMVDPLETFVRRLRSFESQHHLELPPEDVARVLATPFGQPDHAHAWGFDSPSGFLYPPGEVDRLWHAHAVPVLAAHHRPIHDSAHGDDDGRLRHPDA